MNIELTEEVTTADLETLAHGLDTHSLNFAPERHKRELGVFVRDENGRVLAGLSGATYWDWLHINMLWVDDSLRGQGVGRQLMEMAEAEARQRGCIAAMVDTHSFQAEGFYVGLGYEVFGRLQDFPRSHERIYLRKRL